MEDLTGLQLGQYTLLSKLGEGGMASVYRARQVSVERDVAVKVIESKLTHNSEFLRRFEREARTLAALDHPHILKIFDFGQQGDLLYLVMEIKTGGNLATLARTQTLSLQNIARLLGQIADALDYAHRNGVIHRDLKPQNILLDGSGNAILTDFGIAKLMSADSTQLTQSGTVMGTPAYMAPEQWQAGTADARTDFYALGILLYELISGQLPFKADTPAQMMYFHLQQQLPSIGTLRKDVPEAIERVLQKAVAKDPNERFSSGSALSEAFTKAIQGIFPPNLDANTAMELSGPLTAQLAVPVGGQITPLGTLHEASPRRNRSRLLAMGALILVGGIALGIALLASRPQTPATVSNTPSSAVVLLATNTTTATAYTPTPTPSETLRPTNTPINPGKIATQTTAARMTLTATAIASVIRTTAATKTAIQQTVTTIAAASITKTSAPTLTPSPTTAPTTTKTPTPIPLLTITANVQWTPIVQSFDGVEMVQVPPGCFMMGSDNGETDEKPVTRICFDKPFWIDKTEVPQAQFAKFGGVAANKPHFSGDQRPVEQVTWIEAQNFCTKRGARLPTEAEWEYAARGPDSLVYPWGNDWDSRKVVWERESSQGTANVGSMERGKSWVGAFHLSGNVAEWVNSVYKPFPYDAADGRENLLDTDSYRVMRGGSWYSSVNGGLRATVRSSSRPSRGYVYVGLRCARSFDAAVTAATPVPTNAAALKTITANAQWTPVVRSFDGVEMVQVPPGCFMMGSKNGEDDEKPVTRICFDNPFWIDKAEVTQSQFAKFGGVAAKAPSFRGDQRPVEQITWFEARDFCAKRDARLPTEAEWEYAARGPDDLVYPWGNDFVSKNLVYETTQTADAGSKSNGKSWVGALDMSGNVGEWVSSIYQGYPFTPRDGRQSTGDTNSARVVRGGSWRDTVAAGLRAAGRSSGRPSRGYVYIGVRCARSD